MSPAVTLLTLALADCDEIVVARSGDLFLACHSPLDKFTVPVNGQKSVNDEMDGYVIRLKRDSHEIVYVTRMGGSAYDSASRVAIDAESWSNLARGSVAQPIPKTSAMPREASSSRLCHRFGILESRMGGISF